MQLYFSPLACSMATRISLYEAGAQATFTHDTDEVRKLNPLGQVPTLRTDDGEVLTENAAILQYVADRFPQAKLAPAGGLARTRLQTWLSYIGTELHKGTFAPLLDKKAPEGAKVYAVEKGAARLEVLAAHLAERQFLLDEFSVADAYLITVLGWAQVTPIDLKKWPAIVAYMKRVRERPSVARALAEEGALYMQSR
jgi:glutathione S-transferase